MDFFNEIRLIWDIICEIGVGNFDVGKGFPPGFEYRWAETKSSNPKSCSGPQYVEYVLDWAEKEMNNDSIFPTSSGNHSEQLSIDLCKIPSSIPFSQEFCSKC